MDISGIHTEGWYKPVSVSQGVEISTHIQVKIKVTFSSCNALKCLCILIYREFDFHRFFGSILV